MLSQAQGTKIHVYTRPTDMRKGFNGLSTINRQEYQADPTDASLFVFGDARVQCAISPTGVLGHSQS